MDYIEELARLLTEQKRLDEKLEETQTSFSDIRKRISEYLVQSSLKSTEGVAQMDEGLIQKEKTFERLLQALHEMKSDIQGKIRPLEEEIVRANVSQLLENYNNQRERLTDCLNGIDQAILDCRLLFENSKKIFGNLSEVNEKLSGLGAPTLPVENSLENGDMAKVLRERIEHLRLQGKI